MSPDGRKFEPCRVRQRMIRELWSGGVGICPKSNTNHAPVRGVSDYLFRFRPVLSSHSCNSALVCSACFFERFRAQPSKKDKGSRQAVGEQ